ncbi:putative conserved hypothetical protein [Colletotrichum sublineola]|uniref:Protein kinase domain-containing protein n=1 Tax=Colletotrichum sublineola TaxID=1173701 RepID=A0A066Y216_COLSU|nr:putative conserved hypothetical protein [Colletotrichum sublineola]
MVPWLPTSHYSGAVRDCQVRSRTFWLDPPSGNATYTNPTMQPPSAELKNPPPKPITISNGIGAVAVRGVVDKPCCVAPNVRHPLEQLEAGARVTITGHQDDYTLTYYETIVLMKNSLVFKAEYSHVPGVAVVKVLRTPSYLAAIVSLYGANDRFLSLYMEYLDAPNLASYRLHLGYCTLGVDEAKRILADMSSAISYVHSQGIAHNDIKPANIMFNRIRGVVLIDFGLSSGLNDSTVHVGGSPWYIPPEYAMNGKRGAPGDVFALGVVMLFVLGKVTLPDLRPRLNWMIADKKQPKVQAAFSMLRWLY